MIQINSGKWQRLAYPKKASTAFTKYSLVDLTAGFVTPSTTTSGASDKPVLGVYDGEAIASSDTTTDLMYVWVPLSGCTIYATTTDGLAATDRGKQMDVSDSVTIAYDGTTYGAVTCLDYLSSTEGIFTISKSPYANVA